MNDPTAPGFTKTQLDWLTQNFPNGPVRRILGGITATTDAKETGAYALLSAEQQKQVDDKIAADEAKAKTDAAQAKVDAAQSQVVSIAQAAVQAAQGTDVNTDSLEQVVAVVQSTPAPQVTPDPAPSTDTSPSDEAPAADAEPTPDAAPAADAEPTS